MKFINFELLYLTIGLFLLLFFTSDAQELHVRWQQAYKKKQIDLILEGHCLGPSDDLFAVVGENTNKHHTSYLAKIRQDDGRIEYVQKIRSRKAKKNIAITPSSPLIYVKSKQKFFISIPKTPGKGGSSIFTIPLDGTGKPEKNLFMEMKIDVHELVNVSHATILCIGQKNGAPVLMMINTKGEKLWVRQFDSEEHRNLSIRSGIVMNNNLVLSLSGLVKQETKMILMKIKKSNGDMITQKKMDTGITPGTTAIRAVNDERFALSTRQKVKNKKKQKGSVHLFDDELNHLWTTDITQTSGLFSTVTIPMIAVQSHIIAASYIEKGVRFHVLDLDGDVQTSFDQRMGPPVRGGGQFLKASSHVFYVTQSRFPVDDLLDWVQEKNKPIIDTITALKMNLTQ